MGRVGPFEGQLSRVTLNDTLKVTMGDGPAAGRGQFKRTHAGTALSDLERMLPRGASFFHDAFRLQLLENFCCLAGAEQGLPPWTGELRLEFRPADREVVLAGHIESAIPDERSRQDLADYCRALALMLQAYAQLPGTPPFSVGLDFLGEWVSSDA